jgi:hypothetical protein
MAKFVMPAEARALSAEQQKAIRLVLVKAGLLTESGETTTLTVANMPQQHKTALNASLRAMGVQEDIDLFGINLGCIAARVAEAAAVAACAIVPGGQIVIAACIAAAHEAANAACN